MSQQSTHPKQTLDPVLFAKLTGGLGDQTTLARLGTAFGQVYAEFLPDIIKSETGLDVSVGYAGCRSGLMSELVAGIGGNCVLVNGSLRNWSQNFLLGCGAGFVMTLMEHMLGAQPETIDSPARPLSVIELDLSIMVFDKIANVLRSAVNATGGFEPYLDPPYNIEDRPKPVAGQTDDFAASIAMTISLGKTVSEIVVIVPQYELLRTVVSAPRAKNPSSSTSAWAEQLNEQVRRSQVTLEARIRLQSLTLDTISDSPSAMSFPSWIPATSRSRSAPTARTSMSANSAAPARTTRCASRTP